MLHCQGSVKQELNNSIFFTTQKAGGEYEIKAIYFIKTEAEAISFKTTAQAEVTVTTAATTTAAVTTTAKTTTTTTMAAAAESAIGAETTVAVFVCKSRKNKIIIALS